jgi:ubiquinone/menaquinone biosynthesis C-methylase UbiE
MISNNRIIQGIYDATWGKLVFAGAYDWFIRQAEKEGLGDRRRCMLASATGRTLEIATGTGLNIPHYPTAVTELVLTEPYRPMLDILRSKVSACGREAEIIQAAAEDLPFPNDSFDTVVGTMILCTAVNPDVVLREVARVLKPGGQYLFLEHVRNPDPKIARRQDWIQPAWFLFGNGCHCNRDAVQTLEGSPLVIEEIRSGDIPHAMSIIKAMVVGRARRRECHQIADRPSIANIQCCTPADACCAAS